MAKPVSQLRIIGGKWRSRRLKFQVLPGVRPTTDANRETLFNWLGNKIIEANCLDLFAGSGALGFEALSRGAKHVLMVDVSSKIIHQLKLNVAELKAENVELLCAKMPQQISKISSQVFDIIFIDPPFHQNLIAPCCDMLENSSFLANDVYLYIETEKELDLAPILPKTWKILRQKVAGQVKYYLIQREYEKT